MYDDTEHDWLAQELKEEGYHGCMSHGGQHVQSGISEELGETSLKNFIRRTVEENRALKEKDHSDRSSAAGPGWPKQLPGIPFGARTGRKQEVKGADVIGVAVLLVLAWIFYMVVNIIF